MAHRFPCPINILLTGTSQTCHLRVFYNARNFSHRFKVTIGRDGKSGLDHINAHAIEQLRDFELFFEGHRRTGGLLPIAQGRIKNNDPIGV